MPHALLLSPDDQAVSAITGVLEEMSVTCERPLDGVSAAQKLNSASFDLVLVDCENLPAAKLIFDVCRRGKSGNNPVPIAIVDGRAGLPTAFRLGAELILTKPVAKDQARTTIRTAVSRVRKNVPGTGSTNENAAVSSPSAAASNWQMHRSETTIPEPSSSEMTGSEVIEEPTFAAAAAAAVAVSSQLTSFAEPAPSFVARPPDGVAPVGALTAAHSATAEAATEKMSSAVDEVDAAPANHRPEPQPSSLSVAASTGAFSAHAAALDSKPAHTFAPSDDPVLAELERTERDESARAESQAAESQKQSSGLEKPGSEEQVSEKQGSEKQGPEKSRLEKPALEKTGSEKVRADKATPDKTTLDKPAAEPAAPVRSPHFKGRHKTRTPLVALLVLVIAAGGFYAAWMYQPGFREIAQPQLDRVLVLVGMPPLTPPSTPANPARVTPAPAPATNPNSSPSTASNAVAVSVDGSPDASPAISGSLTAVQPSAAPGKVTAQPISGMTSTSRAPTSLFAGKADAAKFSRDKTGDVSTVDNKTSAAAADFSSAPLPGENSAIILSSKGAQNRLAYSVAPKLPAGAHSDGEGTVVLKAVVDEDGKVAGVRLVEGNPTVAGAAIRAVKQWRYRPYLRDGKAQAFQTVVIVDFQRP